MKILLATSAALPTGGGIASYNQELQRELGQDNELYLLTDSNERDIPGYREIDTTYANPIHSFTYCQKLVDKINGSEFDLVINSNSSVIPYLVPFIKIPIISVSHFVNGRLADSAGYNSKYTSSIIALSYYGKMYLEQKFSIRDKNKVKVIYNFVANNGREYNREKEESSILTIVYPGGTSVQKSVDTVVETAYRLERSNLPFRFIWIGGTNLPSGNQSLFGLKEVSQMIKDTRIRITGKISRDESIRYLNEANIFLLPSRGEGCPMTLLEAMRAGCIPIVSDAHHGSRELLEKCGCGEIVKQNNSKALYETIAKIIRHHKKYGSCYSKTYEFSKTFLSQREWSRQMLNLFNEALSSTKEYIPLTETNFNRSLSPYKRLMYFDRIKTMLMSGKIRLRLDWSYFKWHILKRI